MKIPLQLVNEQLQVVAYFKSCRRVKLGVVNFVIDTGTNRSMLSFADVEKLNVPQNTLEFKEHTQIGGGSLGLFSLGKSTILFIDDKANDQKIELDEFLCAKPNSKKKEAIDTANSIPSLIGLDFLIKTNLSLHCIPSEKKYYLEGTA